MILSNRVCSNIEAENWTLKQQLKWNLWVQSLSHEYHWLPWQENFSYHIKQTLFILFTTICWSHLIATPKINWHIFTCITIHQTFVRHEPWRRQYTLTSKFWIPFDLHSYNHFQQTTDGRHTNHSKQYIIIFHNFSPTRHQSKVSHGKIKPLIVLKIPSSSPCQECNHSFVNSTKITWQTYRVH